MAVSGEAGFRVQHRAGGLVFTAAVASPHRCSGLDDTCLLPRRRPGPKSRWPGAPRETPCPCLAQLPEASCVLDHGPYVRLQSQQGCVSDHSRGGRAAFEDAM